MKMLLLLSCGAILTYLASSAEVSSNETNKDEKSFLEENAIGTLKAKDMGEAIKTTLTEVSKAKGEIKEFQAKVVKGEIKVEKNQGSWTAASEKNRNVIKFASYSSEKGPVNFFTKRVYTSPDHTNEDHMTGYDIYFYTNGLVETYLRRDWGKSVSYFENGRLKKFNELTANGVYIIEWDSKGNNITEHLRKGPLIKKDKEASEPLK